MDNPATPPELVKRGHTIPQGSVVEQTRLDEAWRALQREPDVRGLAARVQRGDEAAGDPTVEDVIDVVCAAALRVLRNPEGHKTGSGGIDDYQESWTVSDATLDVYFTAAELRRLAPPAAPPTPTAGSIQYS